MKSKADKFEQAIKEFGELATLEYFDIPADKAKLFLEQWKNVPDESQHPAEQAYNANFLWGFTDDSIETLGYEFANAKTEVYQKECWENLVKKLSASQPSGSEPTAGECQHIATFTARGRPVCMKCGKVFEEAE